MRCVFIAIVLAACGNHTSSGVDASAMRTACGSAGLTCEYATQICVVQTPIGPGESYTCMAVPTSCVNDRTCACAGSTLCTGTFNACFARPDPNTLACECAQCQ